MSRFTQLVFVLLPVALPETFSVLGINEDKDFEEQLKAREEDANSETPKERNRCLIAE
jgi:hypothetical protein